MVVAMGMSLPSLVVEVASATRTADSDSSHQEQEDQEKRRGSRHDGRECVCREQVTVQLLYRSSDRR